MIEDLKDCDFHRILFIGSVVKYRRGLAMALLRLLDKPKFSAMDPYQQGLPEQDYEWHEIDLVIVDMSEHKASIRSWYFDLVTQTPLPMVIFIDRAATVDDAGDMVRAGGADYIDLTKLSPKRLTRALLMAANMRQEKPQPVRASADEPIAEDVSAENDAEVVTDLLPEVQDEADAGYEILPDGDGLNDEPTETMPRLDPTTLNPVYTDAEVDNSLKNPAYGPVTLADDVNDSTVTEMAVQVDDSEEDSTSDETAQNDQLYVKTGFTGEMEAYRPPVEDDGMSEASFVTTGLMSILERTDQADGEQEQLPEHQGGQATNFSMGQRWPFTPRQIESGHAKLGNYQVIEFVAVGGTASVFKARQLDSGKMYAMKLFDMDTADKQGQQRFIRGYQLIQKVRHPHVVKIHDLQTTNQSAFAIMEYFPGGDLKQRITRGISRDDAIRFTAAIASSLHAAHEENILHRDLKPSNIMFRQDGELALLDFGIAKLMAESRTNLTFSGQVVGTPHYLSPEQAVGGQLDGRSDLYSLGVMLFEMLEGKRPYLGDSSLDIMRQHVNGPIPDLSDASDPLNGIIGRLLSKERDERYANGFEVIRALANLTEESFDGYLKLAV